jgi:hypothetical protein
MAAQGMETMGKGTAHQSQADDGDGLIGKVIIAVHNISLYLYMYIIYNIL